MKLSIITVVYNGVSTIAECVASVVSQTYDDIEYIIVDGGSTDGTLAVIDRYRSRINKVISEPDRGIYDAMNKGIALATGDVIGLLNADDMYADRNVLERIVAEFAGTNSDACYSDLVYVENMNTEKIVRYWRSCDYKEGLFRRGWMPPHPTLYIKRSVYERLGAFDLRYKIASDADLMMRFFGKHNIKTRYIPQITVKMRLGGASNKSLGNIIRQNIEIYEAARRNGIGLSLFYLLYKLRDKLSQFYDRPK